MRTTVLLVYISFLPVSIYAQSQSVNNNDSNNKSPTAPIQHTISRPDYFPNLQKAIKGFSVKQSTPTEVSNELNKEYPWLKVDKNIKIYAESPEDFVIVALGLENVLPPMMPPQENMADAVREKYPWIPLWENAQIYAESVDMFARDHLLQRKSDKQTYRKMQQVWKEYQEGKRTWQDAYVAVKQLSMTSPREEKQSWREARSRLATEHSEAIQKNEPIELSEVIAEKKKEKEKRISKAEIAKNWDPEDNIPVTYYQDGNNVVIEYQYKMEFYLKESSHTVRAKKEHVWVVGYGFYDNDKEIELKPLKTLTFANVINDFAQKPLETSRKAVLLCADPYMGYEPRSNAERVILYSYPSDGVRYRYPFKKKTYNYDEFCGVINLKGDIIYDFQFKQTPVAYYFPLDIALDGHEALLGVQKLTYTEGVPGWGNYYELIWWQFPDKVEKIPIIKESKNKIITLKKRLRGIPPLPTGW